MATANPTNSSRPTQSPAPWWVSMMWLSACNTQCRVANASAGTRHVGHRTAASNSRPSGISNVALSKM